MTDQELKEIAAEFVRGAAMNVKLAAIAQEHKGEMSYGELCRVHELVKTASIPTVVFL